MPTKKHRKKRKTKKEPPKEVTEHEDTHDDPWTVYLRRKIKANIDVQKMNEHMEPLYSLMTTLKIYDLASDSILETINIQDYDRKVPGGYIYAIKLEMHQEVSKELRTMRKMMT